MGCSPENQLEPERLCGLLVENTGLPPSWWPFQSFGSGQFGEDDPGILPTL